MFIFKQRGMESGNRFSGNILFLNLYQEYNSYWLATWWKDTSKAVLSDAILGSFISCITFIFPEPFPHSIPPFQSRFHSPIPFPSLDIAHLYRRFPKLPVDKHNFVYVVLYFGQTMITMECLCILFFLNSPNFVLENTSFRDIFPCIWHTMRRSYFHLFCSYKV